MSNWKQSFLAELDSIGSKHKITKDKAFLFWYIKFISALPNDQIIEEITDKSKDAACDAVILDHDSQRIKIIQAKFTQAIGETPFDKDELTKLSKVYDYLTNNKENYQKLRTYIHKHLKEKLDRAINLIRDQGYEVDLCFITTHKQNQNSQLYEGNGKIKVHSAKDIEIKFEEWKHGHVPELGEIILPYLDIMNGPNNPQGHLVNIKSSELKRLYLKYKNKLFSRNVRIFFGDKKKPNKAMEETLLETPDKFWYFNNGITILSEELIVKKEEKELILKNPQIINGCQTVSTIGENEENDAELFAKIVEIPDDTINQKLIDGIVEANNRQTPVTERMLKSNHPIQVKLSRELEHHNYYYERKEGQYNEEKAKSNSIAKLKCIKNIDLSRANIAVSKAPHLAHEKEDLLFSTHFSDVFKENKRVIEYLLPYVLWKKIMHSTRHTNEKRKRFNKLGSFHALKLLWGTIPEINKNTKLYDLLQRVEHQDFTIFDKTNKKILDIAFNVFKISKFHGLDSGQRDFFKNKETYNKILTAIPTDLKREIRKISKAINLKE